MRALPPDPGGRVGALRDYDFFDPAARERFNELLDVLQRQLLQQYFEGMRRRIGEIDADDVRRSAELTRDLNELLRRRLAGLDPEFEAFMAKWREAFPPGLRTLDDLLDHLQGRVAQMQSLMRSMPADQREQLQELMQTLLQDHRLQWDLVELAELMQQLRPFTQGSAYPFMGDESLTLQDALRLMGDLNDLEALERRDSTECIFECYNSFRKSPVPIIGVVQGKALGFGCSIAALCDITIAAESATFQVPEMLHNIMPTMVASALIDRVPRKHLGFLVYSTDVVSAEDAFKYGLVSKVVAPADLEKAEADIVARLTATPQPAQTGVKEYLRTAGDMHVAGAVDFARNIHAVVNSSSKMQRK